MRCGLLAGEVRRLHEANLLVTVNDHAAYFHQLAAPLVSAVSAEECCAAPCVRLKPCSGKGGFFPGKAMLASGWLFNYILHEIKGNKVHGVCCDLRCAAIADDATLTGDLERDES